MVDKESEAILHNDVKLGAPETAEEQDEEQYSVYMLSRGKGCVRGREEGAPSSRRLEGCVFFLGKGIE